MWLSNKKFTFHRDSSKSRSSIVSMQIGTRPFVFVIKANISLFLSFVLNMFPLEKSIKSLTKKKYLSNSQWCKRIRLLYRITNLTIISLVAWFESVITTDFIITDCLILKTYFDFEFFNSLYDCQHGRYGQQMSAKWSWPAVRSSEPAIVTSKSREAGVLS